MTLIVCLGERFGVPNPDGPLVLSGTRLLALGVIQ